MSYPTTILANSDPSGTSNLISPDHASLHTTVNDDLAQVESKLGIGAGSASLDKILVGSGSGTSAWNNVWNNGTLGTATFNKGTLGTSLFTAGTITNTTINSSTIGTPSITGGTQTNYIQTMYQMGSVSISPGTSTSGTLNLSTGSRFLVNMPASAGSVTLVVTNPTSNQPFIVEVLQGAAGLGTINWFSTIRWAGSTVPPQTLTASRKDTFGFIITGSGGPTFDGYIVGQNL